MHLSSAVASEYFTVQSAFACTRSAFANGCRERGCSRRPCTFPAATDIGGPQIVQNALTRGNSPGVGEGRRTPLRGLPRCKCSPLSRRRPRRSTYGEAVNGGRARRSNLWYVGGDPLGRTSHRGPMPIAASSDSGSVDLSACEPRRPRGGIEAVGTMEGTSRPDRVGHQVRACGCDPSRTLLRRLA